MTIGADPDTNTIKGRINIRIIKPVGLVDKSVKSNADSEMYHN